MTMLIEMILQTNESCNFFYFAPLPPHPHSTPPPPPPAPPPPPPPPPPFYLPRAVELICDRGTMSLAR
jgi:hypothetical protein